MQLIKMGAEASLYLSNWYGRTIVIKKRMPKIYRVSELDQFLRTERIKTEVKLMTEARKLGVPVPIIYDIDFQENHIIMEYIIGPQIKEILGRVSAKERKNLCKKIGALVSTLHKNDIIHGDLTTSNMILHSGRIYFIDLSLGSKSSEIEAKGVDMHLLKEAFQSAHSEIFESFELILNEYCKNYKEGKKIIAKIKEIEERGRYT